MIKLRRPSNLIMGMVMFSFLFGCSSEAPSTLGVSAGGLAPCPDRPNCVASDAADDAHRIAPFDLTGDQATAWTALNEAVAALERTTIITDDGTYLHAEAKSRFFGFVDDLEFHLRPDAGLIAIRSAARTGRSDFGVNAERIETLRAKLLTDGVLR